MSYTVLARRYRSATFDEVVGQNHVAQTLKKAIASDRIAHAYLFCGTRGVGKTSMARILAKALNCEAAKGATPEPCLKCSSCNGIARGEDIDVIEIDAASNTGVDNVRDIIANAQYRPARSRFKVYIIDEVHMLSKQAFNALLKTMEEPPEHVKFILATTEPEKVLPTILSRCQRYDFRNIPTREIAGHLRNICADEKIQADEDALILVAKAGAGSMRDSLSLLDRLLSIGEKTLTIETIEQLLGLPRTQLIFDIVQAMGEARTSDVLTAADRMISEGLSPDSLLASLIDHLRNLLIVRTCGVESNLVEVASISAQDLAKQAQRFDPVVLTQDIAILEDLRRQIRQSQAGRALLDATLVRLALADQFSSIADLLGHVDGQPTSPGDLPGQKKKPEPVEVRGPAGPVASIAPAAGLSAPVMRDIPAIAAAPAIAPVPSGPMSLDLDEDDDLPRPGKVWDDSGPSLSEMLKQQTATAVAPPPPAAPAREEPNIAAVDITNFPVIWRNLLAELKDNVGVHPLLLNGQLVRIEDGQAVIRYAPEHDQFPKMLNRNGKRELVGETLSRVIGKAVGVRFDVDASAAPPPPVAVAAPEPAPNRPAARSRPAPEPVMAAAPAPPPARLTPEQMAEFEADPLIKAVMQELDATMVRISDDV